MSSNPFEAPGAQVEPERPPVTGGYVLAERSERFIAAFIDGLIGALIFLPLALTGETERATSGSALWFLGTDPVSVATTVLWVAVMALEAYLVTTRGQSIGKIAIKIRIVTVDGHNPGFVRGVLIRSWAIASISYLPGLGASLGGLLALVDVLFIFGEERRCLHDIMAGTRVVAVEPE